MPGWVRIVMFVLAAVAGLLLAAVVFVALTFDAEDFKSLAIERVQREYQRTLAIAGDVELRFLPRLGVELGAVSLSERDLNAAGRMRRARTFRSLPHPRRAT